MWKLEIWDSHSCSPTELSNMSDEELAKIWFMVEYLSWCRSIKRPEDMLKNPSDAGFEEFKSQYPDAEKEEFIRFWRLCVSRESYMELWVNPYKNDIWKSELFKKIFLRGRDNGKTQIERVTNETKVGLRQVNC